VDYDEGDSAGTPPLGERLARMSLGILRLIAGSIAATTMLVMGVLLVITTGGEGPDAWHVAFPGILTPWIYAPQLLARLLALLAPVPALLLAGIVFPLVRAWARRTVPEGRIIR